MTSLGQILRPLFGVSQKQATDFDNDDRKAVQRLETAVRMVTEGCHLTLRNSRFDALVERLNAVEPELRGFAYEGAGTGLAALDCLMPWKNRTKAFLDGPGSAYIYAVHIGAGLALPRLRKRPEPFLARLDPVFGWFVMDGYGFHEGFFARRRYVVERAVPKHLSPYGRRAFDHGLGRSLWFVVGAKVDKVAATIGSFAAERHADLWRGVGLACGYTGGVDRATIEALRRAAGPYSAQLAVGAAIAANARKRSHDPGPYADLACEVLCGVSSDEAARIADVTRENLPTDGVEPAYEIWRQRLASQFAVPAAV